jgi:hypothetical protein
MNCLHNHGITHSPTSLYICRRTSHSSRLGDGADGAATQRGALAAQRLPGGATTPIKVRFSGGATTPQHRYSPTSQGTQHNGAGGRWVGGSSAPQRRAAPRPPPPPGAAAASGLGRCFLRVAGCPPCTRDYPREQARADIFTREAG